MRVHVRPRMIRSWMTVTVVCLLVVSVFAAPSATGEPPVRDWLDIRVFAEVPDPGYPEGMAVAPGGEDRVQQGPGRRGEHGRHDGAHPRRSQGADLAATVYVGTHQQVFDLPDARSRIFAYDGHGTLIREYEIEGQDPSRGAGVLGMALDADDVLYIVDRYPQRVIALDTVTGEQWDYATFEQVRRVCVPSGVLILLTMCAYADDVAFAEDGTLYVTDVAQGLIWRVPPGGGPAQQWFTDPRILSPAGPNGIEVMADGSTIMFAQTIFGPVETYDRLTGGEPGVPGTTYLYMLTVNDDGSPGELEVFWEGRPGDGIDGFAIAASGNIYAAMGLGNAVAVISPDGVEIGRSPANEVENLLLDVPMDTPGSIKFLGDSVLVSNHAPFLAGPGAHVVFDVHAGEPGLPKFRPSIARPDEPPPPFERTCTLMVLGWCIV